jgi:NTE family protein
MAKVVAERKNASVNSPRVLNPVTGALRQATTTTALPPAPLGPNPLRGVLEGLLTPAVFGADGIPTLIVSATRVRTGEARLFRSAEVTAEVLLASACLPQLFPSVEIEGDLYWDGGYAANPPLRPLIEAGAPADVILVRTTPTERPRPPRGAADIRERAAELAFGTALRQELRSIAVAQRLLAELPEAPRPGTALARLREARLHLIGAEEAFRALPGGSALDVRWGFLRQLRDLGHEAAERWLGENLATVGVRSTLDLAEFAGPAVELRTVDDRPPPSAPRVQSGEPDSGIGVASGATNAGAVGDTKGVGTTPEATSGAARLSWWRTLPWWRQLLSGSSAQT